MESEKRIQKKDGKLRKNNEIMKHLRMKVGMGKGNGLRWVGHMHKTSEEILTKRLWKTNGCGGQSRRRY